MADLKFGNLPYSFYNIVQAKWDSTKKGFSEKLLDGKWLPLASNINKESKGGKAYYQGDEIAFSSICFCFRYGHLLAKCDKKFIENYDFNDKEVQAKWEKESLLLVLQCDNVEQLKYLAEALDFDSTGLWFTSGFTIAKVDVDALPPKDELAAKYKAYLDGDDVDLSALQDQKILLFPGEDAELSHCKKTLTLIGCQDKSLPWEVELSKDKLDNNQGSSYSKNSNYSGGGYYKPEDRLEFIKQHLPGDTIHDIVRNAMSSESQWYALQTVLAISGTYTPNLPQQLDNYEQPNQKIETSDNNPKSHNQYSSDATDSSTDDTDAITTANESVDRINEIIAHLSTKMGNVPDGFEFPDSVDGDPDKWGKALLTLVDDIGLNLLDPKIKKELKKHAETTKAAPVIFSADELHKAASSYPRF